MRTKTMAAWMLGALAGLLLGACQASRRPPPGSDLRCERALNACLTRGDDPGRCWDQYFRCTSTVPSASGDVP